MTERTLERPTEPRERLRENLEAIDQLRSYASGLVDAPHLPTEGAAAQTALVGPEGRAEVDRWLRYFAETIRLLDDVKSVMARDAGAISGAELPTLIQASDRALSALQRRLVA